VEDESISWDTSMTRLFRSSIEHPLGLVMASYFGPTNIPPLEALLLGVPVIASTNTRAQLGDAAVFFDPGRRRRISQSIESLESPKTRKKRGANGKALLATMEKQREAGYTELANASRALGEAALALEAQALSQHLHVTCCFDVIERVLENPVLVHNKRRANNTHDGLPIHGFLAKGPIGVVNAQVLIAQQGKPRFSFSANF
jgi:hypothetical protein